MLCDCKYKDLNIVFKKDSVMNVTAVFSNLITKLENSLKCSICDEKCIKPVRIKTCGHYFCEDCLRKSVHWVRNCPKCHEFYQIRHLDYKNIARSSQDELLKLKNILNEIKNTNSSIGKSEKVTKSAKKQCQPITKSLPKSSDYIFSYNNNKYHVNFINGVSKKNAKGETPLHLACKRRKFNDVKQLIEQRVDLNAQDYAGWAPLHEAVQSQSLEIVEYLLQKGCLINIPGAEFVTPLHQAASLNDAEISGGSWGKILGIKMANSRYRSPAYPAYPQKPPLAEMVKLILKYGADKNLIDYTGLKPIDSAENETIKEILESSNSTAVNKTFEVFLSSNISVYCYKIDKNQKKKLKECKNINVVDKMDTKKKLTHFVVKQTHKLSFKILQAMVEGLQFLTQSSIDDYIAEKYFINIPESIFLINNDQLNSGIRKSMISALLKFPKLFDGINFYIENHNTPVDIYNLKVDREYLSKLIKAGGGRVLYRPPATRTCETELNHSFFAPEHSGTYRCCNFIIYPEKDTIKLLHNTKELQHKSSKWLIDCVIKYEISD